MKGACGNHIKSGSHISKEHALDHIFGYTIVNDITARDLQKNINSFYRQKPGYDMPDVRSLYISLVSDPQSLKVETRVNGELRQSGSTGDMIFPIAELIETLSKE